MKKYLEKSGKTEDEALAAALRELGAEITAYYATEIDKYAVQTTQHNYPDTMQLGDAFQVRAEDWHLPEPVGMEAPANG